ncbi:MAG: 50S ribosomal protein L28 [Myxococcales bacterium]|nr:50S ribosomal protein L28 [Myxococcales bacterium]
MSRRCKLSGKRPLAGNNVSHSNRKTRTRQEPNLQNKRIFIPELGRWVRLRVSTRALRTIDKKGLMPYLRDTGLRLQDVTSSR